MGSFYLQAAKDLEPRDRWDVARSWCSAINCWDHSDVLSGVIAECGDVLPEEVYPVLADWRTNDNPWLRRQSLVGLLFYARFRRSPPPADIVLSAVAALLDDTEYYVQKGLGWTLRECFIAYPDRTLEYLRSHAGEISPVAWPAACEKLTPSQKEPITQIRKAARRAL